MSLRVDQVLRFLLSDPAKNPRADFPQRAQRRNALSDILLRRTKKRAGSLFAIPPSSKRSYPITHFPNLLKDELAD
jgi:hypothetical protein